MQTLICATSNNQKFNIGHGWFKKYGVTLEQVVLDIDEIQGEKPEAIIRDKARRAYELLGKPVVVTDDSWDIPGLNGFPGAYMKSMNHWFSADDFIRLTKDLADRRIILHQFVAYQDELETVIFNKDIYGTLITEPRGSVDPPHGKITVLDADNGKTISEIFAAGEESDPERMKRREDAWQDLAKWYAEKIAV